MSENKTIYQKLGGLFGSSGIKIQDKEISRYNIADTELLRTTDKTEFELGKKQMLQNKYLQNQWQRVEHEIFQKSIHQESTRIGSYSDFEAMEFYPEIAAALDLFSEECCTANDKGKILNIYSDSERVRGILEDLFFNRLDINTTLHMWVRNVCKLGDNFLYLNMNDTQGIIGGKQLPIYEIERREVDLASSIINKDKSDDTVKFVWRGRNIEFNSWQIAHFRLLNDDRKLPYGTSLLEKCRRIWKGLVLMEDAMMVYRITRAPERRVFKVNVGNIDEEDVPAYINQMANKFKRTPVIDSKTGQIDTKYNQYAADQDYIIPVRSDNAPSPIETLPGACISLNTRIPLLDGRILMLSEIIEEWDNGNRNLWVYSCDPYTGKLAPGMITWAGETRKNAEVIKITLDNGEEVISTPDHKFVHRTNGFVEAKDLVVGDSLMPYYTKESSINNSKSKYKQTWDSSLGKWSYDHRFIANYFKSISEHNEMVYSDIHIDSDKNTIHHKDINRFNNNPDNLVFMNNSDHYNYHSETFGKSFSSIGGVALWEKISSDEELLNNYKETRSIVSKNMWANRTDSERDEVRLKQSLGLINYIKSLTDEERIARAEKLNKATHNPISIAKRVNTLKNNPNMVEAYKNLSIKLKAIKGTDEYKAKASNNAKRLWENPDYASKIFTKEQKLIFSDKLYGMFVKAFASSGRADKALIILNSDEGFMSEYKSLNVDIRSSIAGTSEFKEHHLNKMLRSRGYATYREWAKTIAQELGYKNLRAMRYYIEKEGSVNTDKFYNHKIVKIEYLNDREDTGTITVDGDEVYHNYHTFAIESGIFIKNSNLDSIGDISYLQAKLFTALRVPKSFLGFDDAMGDGKNLALQDIRFTRTVNRIQQAIIMELNKIAIIHLYLLGFEDELDNFSITMNNPSTQAEMLKIEHWQKRITVYQEAVRDAGNGFGAMSMTRAKKDFLGMSNDEIKQDLLEQRMEKAAAAELEQTSTVIKKTGFFDIVDNIYGIPEDEREYDNTDGADTGESDAKGGFGGGGGFGGDDMDLGDDTENTDDTEQTDTGEDNKDSGFDDAGADSFGGDEADFGKKEESFIHKTNNILTEKKDILNKRLSDRTKRFESIYTNRLIESVSPENINRITSKFSNNSMSVNNDIDFMIKSIDKLVGDE